MPDTVWDSMKAAADFFESVINSLTDHIAIIDVEGTIEFVNAAWVNFGTANDSKLARPEDWIGVDYLQTCDPLSGPDESDDPVLRGTMRVIDCHQGVFSHEYPCHSETEKRWFVMRVTPLQGPGPPRFVISHQNITKRKLAEEKVTELSLIDGLTSLPNRRRFDEFMESEWRRGVRDQHPVSLLMLDVDHFKLYNDHYGHAAGDECLKRIATTLRDVTRRPGDLPARYGGEEFAVVMGATDAEAAEVIASVVLYAIEALAIPHEASPTREFVTVSIGVATLVPDNDSGMRTLFEAADKAMYDAKHAGRNRVVAHAS